MKHISVGEGGLEVVVGVTDEGDARLLHCSTRPYVPAPDEKTVQHFRMLECQVTGENQHAHHGSKHVGTAPGNRLRYQAHRITRHAPGPRLEVDLADGAWKATVTYQCFDGLPVLRAWTTVTNGGTEARGLEYVSSFMYMGLARDGLRRWDEKSRLHLPHNTWFGEAQWRCSSLPEQGMSPFVGGSMKRLSIGNTGTWSSSGYLPMAAFENTEAGTTWFWQIEHNGSWHWEMSDAGTDLYVQLSGPTENENLWWKELQPGESFTTVPVAFGCVNGDFEAAMGVLNEYRRAIRRPNDDNRRLPVIFNDYMNCLWGDPTTARLLPLIDAAAKAGCEYFCIDAGWYSDGFWWDGVGEWLPSAQRFPGGIREPLDYIRSKGMIPGLWLEIEVMGIKCPLASKVPDDWFFVRHGRRIIDHSRYQLDFRNPAVQKHADAVLDRLVQEYGVGYIKMDYNINGGPGTEIGADSVGDGLLEHNRAYLAWLDRALARHPALVIENCGSGGMRMDYGMLSRLSVQSSSDQTDYRKYAVIATSCAAAVTPEQCAVWSYPLKTGDREEVIFNMVNAMLMRIHQSGHLAEIAPERFNLVQEGLSAYKQYRHLIPIGRPFWPLGMPTLDSEWTALGLDVGGRSLLAVWRLQSRSAACTLPVQRYQGRAVKVSRLYPAEAEGRFGWNPDSGSLTVDMPQNYCARLFNLEPAAP